MLKTHGVTVRSDMKVELIDRMSDDNGIVQAMLVSTLGEQAKEHHTESAAYGRLNFLMKNRHGTPFEHGAMTFYIEAPIFVFREFHRHRIGWSYNEMSARYKEMEDVFYVPDNDRPLKQVGKPGHYEFVSGTKVETQFVQNTLADSYAYAFQAYKDMIAAGIAKEVARSCLPVGIYSSMYATANPRSIMSFLSLRTKAQYSMFPSYPQREIEMVAEKIEQEFKSEFPMTHRSFVENGRVAP